MKLIPNWRRAWRMYSMQAKAAAAAMLGSWQALPVEWQQHIPLPMVLYSAIGVLVLGALGRLVDQPKVKE